MCGLTKKFLETLALTVYQAGQYPTSEVWPVCISSSRGHARYEKALRKSVCISDFTKIEGQTRERKMHEARRCGKAVGRWLAGLRIFWWYRMWFVLRPGRGLTRAHRTSPHSKGTGTDTPQVLPIIDTVLWNVNQISDSFVAQYQVRRILLC